jgi:hypothetical protein
MAALYRCIDQTGRSVFTDRTVQMTQCVPLSVENLSSSPSLPAPPSVSPTTVPTEPSLTTRVLPLDDSQAIGDHDIVILVQRIGQLHVVPVELNGSRTM